VQGILDHALDPCPIEAGPLEEQLVGDGKIAHGKLLSREKTPVARFPNTKGRWAPRSSGDRLDGWILAEPAVKP
jgi:hypothetical protein